MPFHRLFALAFDSLSFDHAFGFFDLAHPIVVRGWRRHGERVGADWGGAFLRGSSEVILASTWDVVVGARDVVGGLVLGTARCV